ncbi:MAG: DUF3800 domain-containing protein [Candidatus Thermoplasmatota archaeon]|nr:DUF3800 domain-containing protein [Candidatus Thermoplasmatota archaeon]MCL5791106.1 DUF3800 domain-containing protein [Candidatus Thermoplasmatota archaeon]
MTKAYIYIDESGDLGLSEKSSRVIVISALVTEDYRPLDRIVKNARRYKFRKELSKANEIKFNNSSRELRIYLVKKLNETPGCTGYHCILRKEKIISEYLRNNKQKLYNYVAGLLADLIKINYDEVEVRIDKYKRKQFMRDEFNNYFIERLKRGSRISSLNIYHSNSENFTGIQLVDLLAGSVFSKYNNDNPLYVDLIDQERFRQFYREVWNFENK